MYHRFYIFLSKLIVLSYFIKYMLFYQIFPYMKWVQPEPTSPSKILMLQSIYQRARQKATLEKLETSLGLVMKAQFL